MTLDSILHGIGSKITETASYEGNSANLKEHLSKALIGGGVLLGMHILDMPKLFEFAAGCYTAFQGYKAYKDAKNA
jgi:hypothetical protein